MEICQTISSGERLPKRPKRLTAFLLLPILAFIFIIGWIMYSTGESRTAKKKPQKNIKQPGKDLNTDENDIEIGAISELPLEQEAEQ